MTSLLDAPHDAQVPEGIQTPRVESFPPFVSSAGAEALEVAELAGLFLDPWQQHVLCTALNERADGKWAAQEVGLLVPRQNGKGSVLEARELAGLFVLGERFIVHSAHQFDTSLDAFRRLLEDIEGVPDFDRRIKRISRSHGEEGIELKNGQRIRFRTRTKGGGRGFTGDCLILDEAMELPETAIRATVPTLRARPNPQTWYVGSAVDQETMDHGVVLARVRERGMQGTDDRLAYFEWSADFEIEKVTPAAIAEPRHWAQSNPALGIRVSVEQMDGELRTFAGDLRGFAVELLGVGDWPATDSSGRVIPIEAWDKVCDVDATAEAKVFALDVNPARSAAAIAAVGPGPTIELVDYRMGTDWIVERCLDLKRKHGCRFAVAKNGPVGALIPELRRKKIRLIELDASEVVRASEFFYDETVNAKVTVRRNEVLDAAVSAAIKRSVGDAWVWDRKARLDISPLMAATVGLWAFVKRGTAQVIDLAAALANAERPPDKG